MRLTSQYVDASDSFVIGEECHVTRSQLRGRGELVISVGCLLTAVISCDVILVS